MSGKTAEELKTEVYIDRTLISIEDQKKCELKKKKKTLYSIYKDLEKKKLYDRVYAPNRALYHAAKGGHLDLVIRFLEQGATRYVRAICGAARGGHHKIIKFFEDSHIYPYTNWNVVMEQAALYGHLHLIKLFGHNKSQWSYRRLVENACEKNHVEVFKYCIQFVTIEYWVYTLEAGLLYAIDNNHRCIIEYIFDIYIPEFEKKGIHVNLDLSYLLEKAFYRNNKQLVDYIISKGAQIDTDVLDGAASGGSFDLLQEYIKKGSICKKSTVLAACRWGDIDIIKYVVQHTDMEKEFKLHQEFIIDCLWTASSWGNIDAFDYFIKESKGEAYLYTTLKEILDDWERCYHINGEIEYKDIDEDRTRDHNEESDEVYASESSSSDEDEDYRKNKMFRAIEHLIEKPEEKSDDEPEEKLDDEPQEEPDAEPDAE